MKILIIESNSEKVQKLTDYFKQFGISVSSCPSVNDAVCAAEEFHFDIAMADRKEIDKEDMDLFIRKCGNKTMLSLVDWNTILGNEIYNASTLLLYIKSGVVIS